MQIVRSEKEQRQVREQKLEQKTGGKVKEVQRKVQERVGVGRKRAGGTRRAGKSKGSG